MDPIGLDIVAVNNRTRQAWQNFNTEGDVIELNEGEVTSNNNVDDQSESQQQEEESLALGHVPGGYGDAACISELDIMIRIEIASKALFVRVKNEVSEPIDGGF